MIVSPEARTSRHVREALEMARMYRRPVCGVWIEGEHWQEYLPNSSFELAALIDARTSDGPVLIGEIATALERVGLTAPKSDRPTSADTDGHVLAADDIQLGRDGHPARKVVVNSFECRSVRYRIRRTRRRLERQHHDRNHSGNAGAALLRFEASQDFGSSQLNSGRLKRELFVIELGYRSIAIAKETGDAQLGIGKGF